MMIGACGGRAGTLSAPPSMSFACRSVTSASSRAARRARVPSQRAPAPRARPHCRQPRARGVLVHASSEAEAEVEVKEAGDESDTDAESADSADEVAVAEAEADAEAKEVRTRVRMRCGGLLRACAAALHSAT